MRVLLLREDNRYAVAEIVWIQYDDEENGLYMVTADDDEIEIPNVSKETCNQICKCLLSTGYYDLSVYGSYELIDDEEYD